MQREITYDTLEAFLEELRKHAIRKISFSETSEKRAEQVQPGTLHVVHVDRVELIAYKDSVLYKCTRKNIDRDALFDRLAAEGFEVTRRNRNIT
jgi:hypothetical protein